MGINTTDVLLLYSTDTKERLNLAEFRAVCLFHNTNLILGQALSLYFSRAEYGEI